MTLSYNMTVLLAVLDEEGVVTTRVVVVWTTTIAGIQTITTPVMTIVLEATTPAPEAEVDQVEDLVGLVIIEVIEGEVEVGLNMMIENYLSITKGVKELLGGSMRSKSWVKRSQKQIFSATGGNVQKLLKVVRQI